MFATPTSCPGTAHILQASTEGPVEGRPVIENVNCSSLQVPYGPGGPFDYYYFPILGLNTRSGSGLNVKIVL